MLISKAKLFKVAFVNAHAYYVLETSLEELPSGHILIVLRDFNAKIGREECFRPTIQACKAYIKPRIIMDAD